MVPNANDPLQAQLTAENAFKPPGQGASFNNYNLPFKVPTGFMPDPNNPLGVVPIEGGPVGRSTPEQAAKKALITQALGLMPTIRSGLIGADGTVNRSTLTSMNATIPFSDGKIIKLQILDAVEAKLRAESGAAVPETEVARSAKRYMPNVLDSDEGIADKLNRLETFLNSALQFSDPESFNKQKEGKAAVNKQVLQEASDAIKQGADRKLVEGRLRQLGIDPKGLK